MTDQILPLTLPTDGWEEWLADRCDGRLEEARRLADVLREGGEGRSADDILRVWNDLNLALRNTFAVASLLANVHPDEAVRGRAERAEQDASRLQTALELDRELYDALAAAEPGQLDEDGRRVLALSLRDFRRAGVERDEMVRDRLRELAERETEVGQAFAKNIRDGMRSVSVARAALDGLPADFVASHPAGEDGTVVLTTDSRTSSRSSPSAGTGPPGPRWWTRSGTAPCPRTTPCSTSCSRCVASTRRRSATTAGRRTTPRSS